MATSFHEALEAFRALSEAREGDYVTTKDGQGGYVAGRSGGKVAVRVVNQPSKKAAVIYVDLKDVTVNPGGAPHG